MKKALLIHGSYGNPNENWFPWLKKELYKKDYKVIAPSFPTPIDQSFKSWEQVIKPYIDVIDDKTSIIAHSIGVIFILKIVEKYNLKPEKIFLISGFLEKLNDNRFDKINDSFYIDINWGKINQYSPQTYIYHSDNDPFVDKKNALNIAKRLPGSRLTIIKQAGHFNIDSGYLQFPQLLEDIISG